MKKLSLILAVLLAAGLLGAPAFAEDAPPVLRKVFEVNTAEVLNASDLVTFREETFGLLGLMDSEGKVLLPAEYYDLSINNTFGYISAAKLDQLNGKGLITAQGDVLIPYEYGEIEIISPEWGMGITLKESTKENYDYQALFGGYGSGYYLVDSRTFYNLKTGKAIGTLPRDAFDQAYGYDGFLIIRDKQDVSTVYDENFQPLGTSSQVYYGYLFEKNGEQWDVKRAGDGKLLFTTPYEVSSYEHKDRTFKINKGGKTGRMDLTGKVILEPEYETLQFFSHGLIKGKEQRDGKYGLINNQGQVVVPFRYDEIHTAYVSGVSTGFDTYEMVCGYAPVEADGKLGFVNDKGEETVPPTYVTSAVKRSANTLLITDATGKCTVVAADGKVTELPYASVSKIGTALDGRPFFVKNEAGQSTVIDWHGNELLPLADYSEYPSFTSWDGSLLVLRNNQTRLCEGYKVEETQP
jgi:hypothetical protein